MFEKVNPMHPDKIADRIAGALVDLAYSREENPKVAVEVLIGHGYAYIIAESSVEFTHLDVEPIVTRIVGKPLTVRLLSIPQDRHLADNQQSAIRCGDNGIFKGCETTHEQVVLTNIAQDLYNKYKTDGKYILRNRQATICQSHMPSADNKKIEEALEKYYFLNNGVLVNPIGEWTGGPDVDCGATNRKLGSDMGDSVTGGGLHGKDLSKADVSVNVACYLRSQRYFTTVTASCSIGDETVTFDIERHQVKESYASVVKEAKEYINGIGGFEKFAEWGLIRPQKQS